MSFDTIISNGTIVDGTNTPRYISDIGITNGVIETIGTLTDVEATNRIDASRLVISPGFIDTDMTEKIDEEIAELKDEDTIFKEVVVTPDSPLLNRNRTYLRRRTSKRS